MEIKDSRGKYIIDVDTSRCISWETNIGVWAPEDLDSFQNDYATKIIPSFKGKKWAICSDVRQYKTSAIDMDKHVAWKNQNGATHGVVIVDSAIVKLQINKASATAANNGGFVLQAFTDIKEADEWLKSKGF